MNIKRIHIIYSGLGGHFDYVFNLIVEGCNEKSTHIIFLGVEPTPLSYIMRCEIAGVSFSQVRISSFGIRAFVSLVREIKTIKPEIVYIHSNAAVLPVYIVSKMQSFKVVLVEHQNNSLKTQKDNKRSLFAQKKFNAIIFLSPSHMSEAKSLMGLGFKAEKSIVIETGIPKSFFTENYRKKNELIIGMQSRMVPIKDHLTLIHAFKIVAEKFPEAKLLLAGDGSERKMLEQQTLELNLQDRVVFNGMLAKNELIDWLEKLTLYVHATFGETSSIALMEAMAHSLPVVASDVTGINTLAEGHGLVMVQPTNTLELAEKMIMILGDPKMQQQLGVKNRNFAEVHFSLSAMVSSFNQFESDILAV